MTIEEILSLFPQKSQKLAHEITKAGLHCIGCGAATWETLESGMLSHGMDLSAVYNLVEKLNVLLKEESSPTTITLTPRAAEKLREFAEDEGKSGWGLRFSEQAAGCSGMEYALDFSEKASDQDVVYLSQGMEIHVKQTMSSRLVGTEIDYIDGLHNSGFKISNPHVKSSCGCGSSHNY